MVVLTAAALVLAYFAFLAFLFATADRIAKAVDEERRSRETKDLDRLQRPRPRR